MILDDLACDIVGASKLAISLYGACLLGYAFLMGAAANESFMLLKGGSSYSFDPWGIVGGYISFACLLFFGAVLRICHLMDILRTEAETREFEITAARLPSGEGEYLDDNCISDGANEFRVCNKLFKLLKEKDIINAEIKKMTIVKIHYIHRISEQEI